VRTLELRFVAVFDGIGRLMGIVGRAAGADGRFVELDVIPTLILGDNPCKDSAMD
jgi:hypothetical protein